MAGLNFAFTADNAGFMRTLNQVTAGMRDASRQIEAEGGSIDRVISQIRNGLTTIGIGWGLKEIAGQVANTRGEFQQLEVAFKTMLGSAEEADTLMNQLVRTAAITPFDLQGVANGAKSLMAYGIEAKDVNQTLIQLGDIAAGLSIPLNDLVYLYGTTMVQGRMFTQDLRQFQGRGIPIADELAKQFGVAKEKVGELVTAGKVGAKEFKAAIDAMTAEGSQFGGLMEAQSKTISGQISNIEDAVAVMFNEIGKSSEGAINIALGGVSQLVEHWQEVLLILGDVAAAYGVQKAALALDAGFTAAATNHGYDLEIAQLKALLPVKEEEQKSSLQQAVTSGRLTQAKADEVLALREEAKAQLDVLVSKENAAKAEEAAAIASLDAADRKVLALQKEKESWLDLYNEAIDAGDAETAQAIATEIAASEVSIKEAADQALVLAEEARTASTNAAAASEARESLATQINTAETAGNTTAVGVLTIAKEKLTAAVLKLNAAMAANSFAIVTGLVIALGYAVYKLCTYESDLDKVLNSADESAKKQQQSYLKELETIDRLNVKLKNAKRGSEQWKSAKDTIISQYGQYIPKLDEEISKVGDLTTVYNQLTEAARLSAAARAMKDFRDKNDISEDVDKAMGDLQDTLENPLRIYENGRLKEEKIIAGALRDQVYKYAFRYIQGEDVKMPEKVKGILANAKFFQNEKYDPNTGLKLNIESSAATARRKALEKKAGEQRIAERYGTTVDKIDGREEKPDTASDTNLQEAYDKAKKDYETAKAEVSKMEANRGKYTQKAYEEAKENLKTYKEAYEKLGGKTKDKQTGHTAEQRASKISEEHQKVIDLMKRQSEDELKLQLDYERQRWQNRIDLMEEGDAKVLEQMRLDQTKERDALKEQESQAIQAEIQRQKALFDAKEDEKAARTKGYGKQVFDPAKIYDPDKKIVDPKIQIIVDRYAKLNEDLQKQQEKADADYLKQEQTAWRDFNKEFGTYQQQRLAIQQEYDEKIAQAANDAQRAILEAQRDNALSDLDFNQWMQSGDIALAFGDISNLSDKTIDKLVADMERYREKVIATLDPEKIAKWEEALTNLRNARIDDSFGAFSTVVPDYFKRRKSVGAQKESAAANYDETVKSYNETYNKIAAIQQKIREAEESGQDTAELEKEFATARRELDRNTLAVEKTRNAFKVLQEQWDKLESPKDKFYGICAALSAATDLVGPLASQMGEMFDAMGAEGLGKALSGIGEAMDSVGNVASGFAQGGLIGGIAAAAGELMKWTTKLFQAGDAKHQKNIEKLQKNIDTLQKSYEAIGRAIDNAFGADASRLIEQQDTLLRQQRTLLEQQMAEEQAKKKSNDEAIAKYQEQIAAIDATLEENKSKVKEVIIGKDIKSAISDFASAYASAWGEGAEAASASMKAIKSIVTSALDELLKQRLRPTAQRFYDTLAGYMKDGILEWWELRNLDKLKEEMDAIAAKEEAQYKMLLDRYKTLEEIQEELTDTTFDSVRDNFKSLLGDMETSSADFSDSFTDMLRNALIEGLMSAKYDKMLEDWYAEFADKMSDQQLTDAERDYLRQKYQSIVDAGIADRNAINEIVGQGAFAQSASQGGFAAMDQDTASELNGRFTAMVELQATSNTLLNDSNALTRDILLAVQNLNSVTQVTTGENTTLLAMKDMMFLSTGYLEDIAKHTKRLVSIEIGIESMRKTLDSKL